MTSRRRPAAPRAPRGVVGWTVQILGELLITLGLVLLLFGIERWLATGPRRGRAA